MNGLGGSVRGSLVSHGLYVYDVLCHESTVFLGGVIYR